MNIVKLLNNKAKFYAKELWDVDFDLPVKVSKRFKTTLGECIYNDSIVLSSRILDNELFTDDILLHELCHWYCKKYLKIGWTDSGTNFIKEIKKTGSHMTNILNKTGNEYYCNNKKYKPKQRLIELNKKFYLKN